MSVAQRLNRGQMKRLFLTGIAALFLATGTAHAERYVNWECGGGITLQYTTTYDKHFNNKGEMESVDVNYGFYVDGLKNSMGAEVKFRKGRRYVNGRRCERKNENHELIIEEPVNFNAWREEEGCRGYERKNETKNP